MYHIHGGGTIIRVAAIQCLTSSSISMELLLVLIVPSRSDAAKAIMVSVFPRPIGSAMMPP